MLDSRYASRRSTTISGFGFLCRRRLAFALAFRRYMGDWGGQPRLKPHFSTAAGALVLAATIGRPPLPSQILVRKRDRRNKMSSNCARDLPDQTTGGTLGEINQPTAACTCCKCPCSNCPLVNQPRPDYPWYPQPYSPPYYPTWPSPVWYCSGNTLNLWQSVTG